MLKSINILRIISGTEYLGGIVCHAETKSVSLTSPNACQFLLAGPKRNQKGLFWLRACYPERFDSPSMAHQNLKNPIRDFIRGSADFLTLMGEISRDVCSFNSSHRIRINAILKSINILRIISGTEYLGGIVCHAETKSVSLTSPNACQFLLAGPKGTKEAFFGFCACYPERFYSPSVANEKGSSKP
ncbi:hypothetical protein P4S72_18725 [Vibrio sp. PP-XX7]